jgi:hypothetical protein
VDIESGWGLSVEKYNAMLDKKAVVRYPSAVPDSDEGR